MPKPSIAHLREDYRQHKLEIDDVTADPIAQFEKWFADAVASPGVAEPNAMTLATASKNGQPSARIVLLKEISEGGFCFFTNFESRKGDELAENPLAALVFWWPPLERQVRIEGRIEKVAATDAEIYFQSRPKGSQIGAWASPQSRPIASREILDENSARLEKQYLGAEKLPLPPFWGGYRLIPEKIEFWQGRSSRLHDRILFSKNTEGNWQTTRLAP